jgi:hypothetical protein
VTFKDLKKRVSVTRNTQYQNRLFEKLHDKPFWIWNAEDHRAEDIRTNGDHIIGLPKKNDIDRPIFDYEK